MESHKAHLEMVGETIRKIRKAKGLSQTELGNLIGLKYQAILHLEKGKNLSLEVLLEISDQLECPLPELLGFADNIQSFSPIARNAGKRISKLSESHQKYILVFVKGVERGIDDEYLEAEI